MSDKDVTQDSSQPVVINVDPHSPHVVSYRFWTKEPDDDEWTILITGETTDDIPDAFQTGPHPSGTLIAWWFGVGGNANTKYRVLAIFSQEDHVLEGGTRIEEGRVDSDGLAFVETSAELT